MSLCPKTLDEYSISKSLKAAASLRSPTNFKSLHATIIKLGFSRFTILMTGLVDLVLKCGFLADAQKMFDEIPDRDVVTWTSMIVGHAHQGFYHESLSLFRRMVLSGIVPNGFSFSGTLIACSGLGMLSYGKEIHTQVVKSSAVRPFDNVVQNGLLDMYARCGSLVSARRLFDLMPAKGIISWNEIMSGYVYCGQAEEALMLFSSMVSSMLGPDGFSYAICIDACAALASLKQGIQVHACIIKNGFDSDFVIMNALVDMYAKCGSIDSAELVFRLLHSRDVVLWTTMISAYGKSGWVCNAVEMFEKMIKLKMKCDEVTYLAVLSACSHGGLVREGWHYFRLMFDEKQRVAVKPEHYGCIVDLLCRSGHLEEALHFIEQMPLKPSIAIWSAFLNSCRIYGNTEFGQLAAFKLLELDPDNHSNWVALSRMHATESKWHETWKIRETMKVENVKKEPGCSWIELNDGVHIFLTADISHPELFEILQTLDASKKDL
ncbi:pentatricopeptide repeat-containing protein At2g13600-like [Typha latifolia]|uniref:pentatricopeptide repeat-containing protein At2g13600-like n=1 Tax=Typha latifolia TaxID=4733 RepID=UPI003C2B742E